MRTENLKKLLTGVVTTASSGSSNVRVITPRSGSFKSANGTALAATAATYTNNNSAILYAMAASDMTAAALFRTTPGYTPTYKAWSAVVADYGESVYTEQLPRYISATYDATDTPIASSDYALKGTDVPCTIAVNDNTKITITFSNSGTSVLHANRIGFTMALNYRLYLMHIFAFDDIALAPGETKSITIQPDLS